MNVHHHLFWNICLESTSFSLRCCTIACKENIAGTSLVFRAKYDLWRSGLLKLLGNWQPGHSSVFLFSVLFCFGGGGLFVFLFFFCLFLFLYGIPMMTLWVSDSARWACSSVGREKDHNDADADSIPRCGEGLFPHSQLSVQTLLRCPYTPRVQSHTWAAMRTLKIL